MKVKKRLTLILLTILAVGFFILSFSLIGNSPTTAQAATTPRYTVTFSYTNTKRITSLASGNQDSVYKSGTNVTSASVKNHSGSNMTFRAYLYGDSYSGSGTLSNGGYVGSSTINISFSSTFSDHTITVTNSSGTQIKKVTATTSIELTGLVEGETYSVAYFGFGIGTGSGIITSYMLDATFSFTLDLTAPTMSGCSTSTYGTKSNESVLVTASDTGSGVKYIYKKGPDDTSFYIDGVYGSSRIYIDEEPGLYQFYAMDNAGNTSQIYYAYFDATPPVGTIYNSSGTAITGSHYNNSFYYTATDEGWGVSYHQYKTPGATSWMNYTSGTTIAKTATNGLYTFRSVDGLANISEEVSVYLDTVAPVGKVYANSTVLSSGGKTAATSLYYSATDTGGIATCYVKGPGATSYTEYSNGSSVTQSGTYYFYCVDLAGNTSSTYTVFMDHDAPVLSCNVAEFSETINKAFTVSASDALSSLTFYYRTPGSSSYTQSSTSSVSFSTSAADGRYYFYAVDALGNISQTQYVDLKVDLPVAAIVNSDTDNRVYATWDNANVTAKLNGNSYTKGTWISAEGNYSLVITDSVTKRSNTYTFTIAHYYEKGNTVPPTCTAQGYTIYECISCDDYYHDDYVPANGHSYQSTVYPPTCLNQGYTVYVCSVCNYTYTGDYKAALGHNYDREVVEPTCTERGYTISTCSRCEYTYTSNYVNPLGHDYEQFDFDPTCTEKGGIRYVCRRCGDEYTVYTASELGHHYYTEMVEPTCEEDGYIMHQCTECEYDYQTDIQKALGHNFTTWVSKHADCTHDGERMKTCDRCSKSTKTAIPCPGHKYSITEGDTENGTKRIYKCDDCGDEYVQYLGDQYTMVSNFVEELFDKYAPYMIIVFLATAGVWSAAMGIAFIIAYKNEDKVKARKMLKNYAIGMIVIFAILVACPYLIKGIAYLVAH